jgi:hypothetical protein
MTMPMSLIEHNFADVIVEVGELRPEMFAPSA